MRHLADLLNVNHAERLAIADETTSLPRQL